MLEGYCCRRRITWKASTSGGPYSSSGDVSLLLSLDALQYKTLSTTFRSTVYSELLALSNNYGGPTELNTFVCTISWDSGSPAGAVPYVKIGTDQDVEDAMGMMRQRSWKHILYISIYLHSVVLNENGEVLVQDGVAVPGKQRGSG